MKDQIFEKLQNMPANHPFWKNEIMFTRPVFLNNSELGVSKKDFQHYLKKEPAVRKLIARSLREDGNETK